MKQLAQGQTTSQWQRWDQFLESPSVFKLLAWPVSHLNLTEKDSKRKSTFLILEFYFIASQAEGIASS